MEVIGTPGERTWSLVLPEALIDEACAALGRLRARQPHLHAIVGPVVQPFVANVLTVCGIRPSMTVFSLEAPHLTRSADALLVNLGMMDGDRRTAIQRCLEVARDDGIPVLLDPVKCDLVPTRLDFARKLLGVGGSGWIVKANVAEAAVLGPQPGALLIVTGAVDRVQPPPGSGTPPFALANGAPVMDRVVGTGCALGALIAALASVTRQPTAAALAGLGWFGVAGEEAAARSAGPGSFVPAFLDALSGFDERSLRAHLRLTTEPPEPTA